MGSEPRSGTPERMSNTATTTDDYFDAINSLYYEGYFRRKGYEIEREGNGEFGMRSLAIKIEKDHADAHPIHPADDTDKYSNLLGFILFLMTERNRWKYEEMMERISDELGMVYQITERSKKLKDYEGVA